TGEDATGGGGLKGLLPLLFPGRTVNLADFTMADVQHVRDSDFAAMYEAREPGLAEFFARGGELLLWHGESDPGPSPVGTTDYAKAVFADSDQAGQSMRYFLLPGVGHCRGGPGADNVEWLD